MGNAVEKGPDIKIQYPVLLPAALAGHGQRVLGGPPRTVPVTVGMEDRLKLFLQQPGGCGLGDPVGHAGHSQNPDPCPMILWYLHRPHRAGHVAARAHPVPQFVEAIPLPFLELADADRVHTRRSGIVTDLLPRLEHKALRNIKRLHLRFRSAHRLLPRHRGWPQVDLACTAPWLRPHYRAFPATTGRSAPVPRGTLPLTVSAAWGPPSRGQAPGITGWPSVSRRQVLQFRASACDELTPPLHRAPPGPRAGSSLAEGPPAGAPLSQGRVPILSFDAI